MNKEINVLFIEQYFNNQLKPTQVVYFEKRLLIDESFKELFNSMSDALDYITYTARHSLTVNMKNMEDDFNIPDKNLQDQERIDIYLQNLTVNPEDVKEGLDQEDEDFMLRYEESKEISNGIEYSERMKLVRRMKKLEEEPKKDKKPKRNFLFGRKMFAIAAGIAVLVMMVWTISTMNNGLSTQQAYEEFYEPYDETIIKRSSSMIENITAQFPDHKPEEVLEAFTAYSAQEFEKAGKLFANLGAESISSILLFYQGQALLASGNADAAISAFESYILLPESKIFQDQATWYLGLAFLKKGDASQSKLHLTELSKGNCKQCTQSKNLLSKLK